MFDYTILFLFLFLGRWRVLAPQVRTIKHPYFPNKYTKAANLLHLNLAIQRHSKYSCRESSTIASDGPPPFERRYTMLQTNSFNLHILIYYGSVIFFVFLKFYRLYATINLLEIPIIRGALWILLKSVFSV